MFKLGLRLSLHGGREVAVRLLLMSISIIIGVTMLLFTVASFHALQTVNSRPCWECTSEKTAKTPGNSKPSVNEASSDPLLWSYSEDSFKNKELKRVDVAALGAKSPVPPGIAQLPRAGEFYASPELARLLRSTPSAELGDRFPGKQVGIIGNAALSDPKELVAFVGRTPEEVKALPRAITVRSIEMAPYPASYSNFLKFVLGIGAIGLLFPMMILTGTATKLSAARREERFAAMRLVGATSKQIVQLASADALVSAILGAIGGLALYALLRSFVAGIALTGAPFFPSQMTPTLPGFVLILVGVPIAAVVAATLSLRRVQISPLGAARHTTPKAPKAWRILPLLCGFAIFSGVLLYARRHVHEDVGAWVLTTLMLGFFLIMFGLVIAGGWLTKIATRLVGFRVRNAASLLAVRRLNDNPKAAFRSVSGLVIAIFVGSVFSGLAPALLAGRQATQNDWLTNSLVASFYDSEVAGLAPPASATLQQHILKNHDTKILPVYALKNAPTEDFSQTGGMISCDALHALTMEVSCPAGRAMTFTLKSMVLNFDAVANYQQAKYFVNSSIVALPSNLTSRPLQAMVIGTNGNADVIETIRTLLATHPGITRMPQTFGEAREVSMQTVNTLQRMVYVGIGITLLVAACNLAVSAGGSLVERKRPFTLLRLAGTPLAVLRKVILIESVIPLVMVATISALTGFIVSAIMVKMVAPQGTAIASPHLGYYLTLAIGLIVAFVVVCMTLPLLKRITDPKSARFE